MTTYRIPTADDQCGCNDAEVDRPRDLIAGGMTQPEASRLLWAGEAA